MITVERFINKNKNMKIKSRLTGIVKKVIDHPFRTLGALGLAGIISITAIKDNVHCGAVTLNSPQENHYTWGILPTITIIGEAKGNLRSYGLFGGGNVLGDNSQITGDMSGYGLFGGGNVLGDNSQITGDMSGYGLFSGKNVLGNNSQIVGNADSKGILSVGPRGDINFLTNTEINMDYTHRLRPTINEDD